jgi:hypothetical protein
MRRALSCNAPAEARSRLLAFSQSELEVEERQDSDRRIHIHIKNDKRATVMDHPSGGGAVCALAMQAVEAESPPARSMTAIVAARSLSRVPAAMPCSRGYSQATDDRSTLVVERYACIKEAREPLF